MSAESQSKGCSPYCLFWQRLQRCHAQSLNRHRVHPVLTGILKICLCPFFLCKIFKKLNLLCIQFCLSVSFFRPWPDFDCIIFPYLVLWNSDKSCRPVHKVYVCWLRFLTGNPSLLCFGISCVSYHRVHCNP